MPDEAEAEELAAEASEDGWVMLRSDYAGGFVSITGRHMRMHNFLLTQWP